MDQFDAKNRKRVFSSKWIGQMPYTIVKYLSTIVDDPNAPDPFGRTLLEVARRKGHSDIVKYIISII